MNMCELCSTVICIANADLCHKHNVLCAMPATLENDRFRPFFFFFPCANCQFVYYYNLISDFI